VVLPDYQGIGIGSRFLTAIAEYWTTKTGTPLFITTSNPQLRNINKKSRWRLTRIGHVSGKWKGRKDLYNTLSKRRITFSFKYAPNPHRLGVSETANVKFSFRSNLSEK
jgi:GNAT superfamily N-acetyltransferase